MDSKMSFMDKIMNLLELQSDLGIIRYGEIPIDLSDFKRFLKYIDFTNGEVIDFDSITTAGQRLTVVDNKIVEDIKKKLFLFNPSIIIKQGSVRKNCGNTITIQQAALECVADLSIFNYYSLPHDPERVGWLKVQDLERFLNFLKKRGDKLNRFSAKTTSGQFVAINDYNIVTSIKGIKERWFNLKKTYPRIIVENGTITRNDGSLESFNEGFKRMKRIIAKAEEMDSLFISGDDDGSINRPLSKDLLAKLIFDLDSKGIIIHKLSLLGNRSGKNPLLFNFLSPEVSKVLTPPFLSLNEEDIIVDSGHEISEIIGRLKCESFILYFGLIEKDDRLSYIQSVMA